ncbi:lipopolysaccharide kinase InaA family protein [Thiolapillus sp.]
MNEFFADGWERILAYNGLREFADFWEADFEWFEPPNYRRGGWSGASRVVLRDPDGGEQVVFLKRQENHTRKTWRNPFSGEPTFRSEARNLRYLNSRDIAAPQLVYYGERKTDRGWQVVLATRELEGYLPLDVLLEEWNRDGREAHRDMKRRLIPKVAGLMRRLHACRQAHNALHAKHIFIHPVKCRACLIDLEKMRPRLTRRQAMLRDLDSSNRHTFHLSRGDRLRFLLQYLGKERFDGEARDLWRTLADMEKRKQRKRRA